MVIEYWYVCAKKKRGFVGIEWLILWHVFFYRALCWNDSTTSLKAANLTGPMVRQLSSDGSLTPDVAAHIMTSILQALQLHGQHEANLGSLLVLGAQLYEILRPAFPNIMEV